MDANVAPPSSVIVPYGRCAVRGRALLLLPLLAGCARAPALETEAAEVPVRLEVVARAPFQPTLTLLGVVQPAGTAEVRVPMAGRLHYPARFRDGLASGDLVASGEVLAHISTPDADLALAEARLAVDAAESEVRRYQKAFDEGVVPEVQLASYKVEAELARKRLAAAAERNARMALRAPLGGWLLVEDRIPSGGEVAAGTVLARVASGRGLRVEARAAASDRHLLRPGLEVRFAGEREGEAVGRGVIREVSPMVEAGGTVPLAVEVQDPTGLPAPGEGVELRVALDRREGALTVPEEALVVAESGNAVYTGARRTGGYTARRRQVETGARGGGRVEILRGLSPGDRVVVGGAAMVTDGAAMVEVREPDVRKEPGTPETPEDTGR